MDFVLKGVIALLFCSLMIQDMRKREVSNLGNLLFLMVSALYVLQRGGSLEKILVFMSVYAFPLVFIYGYLSDFLQKEVLGFGDIKFVMGIGTLMSTHSLWGSLYYFYLISFCFASILGILYYLLRKQREIPMLPAFCIGFCVVQVLL